MKFEELILDEKVLKALEDKGFQTPSKIQEKVIPLIKEGFDVIGHAKTGTGKTAAFGLPLIERMKNEKKVVALVLVPTRELAKQVKEEFEAFAKYKKGIKVVAVYGGQSYQIQRKQLSDANVVVATPGRLIDLLKRKYLTLDNVEYLVLDEADEMLSIGFAQELSEIVAYVNKDRQTMLFSATYNDRVYKLTKDYLNDPKKVSVVSKDKVASKIEQKYLLASKASSMINNLLQLISIHQDQKIMIFANTKKQVDEIVQILQKEGLFAEAIHGDLSQKMRENVISKFKKDIIRILVCSDVAARGLDIDDVDVIINYDLPFEDEYYVHRVGRTGRADKSGIAYTILASSKERKLKRLEKMLQTNIAKMVPLSSQKVRELNDQIIIKKIENAINNNKEDFIDRIKPLMKKGYDLDSIFNALLSLNFDSAIKEKEVKEGVRLFINKGKKDNFSKKDLISLFNLGKDNLYDINIQPAFSFCTILVEDPDATIAKARKVKFKNKSVNIEISNN